MEHWPPEEERRSVEDADERGFDLRAWLAPSHSDLLSWRFDGHESVGLSPWNILSQKREDNSIDGAMSLFRQIAGEGF